MKRNYLISLPTCVFAAMLLIFASCEAQPVANATGDKVAEANRVDSAVDSAHVADENQDVPNKKPTDIMDFASKLIDKAKDTSGQAVNQASDSGQDVMDYATQMYRTLKDQGLTKATDASSWLREDFNNMNAIEYKVLKTTVEDPAEFEDTLNEMGKARWECFHVQEKDGATTFYFKKPRRSYMRNIPMRDMIRMVPFMGNGE